jgi:hypothetical protein
VSSSFLTPYMDLDENIFNRKPICDSGGIFRDFNTNRSPAIDSARVV